MDSNECDSLPEIVLLIVVVSTLLICWEVVRGCGLSLMTPLTKPSSAPGVIV